MQNHFKYKIARRFLFALLCCAAWLTGCATSDASLREAGKNEAYIKGYHDGRKSGMNSAGNYFESYTRDDQRFSNDASYRDGWTAGEKEGVSIQTQANVGVGAAGTHQIMNEADKTSKPNAKEIGHDVMKNTDTSNMKYLK